MAEELVAAETIVLDGVDGAVYTYTENGEKKTAEGTYMPEGTSYSFVSTTARWNLCLRWGRSLTARERMRNRRTSFSSETTAPELIIIYGSGSIYYFPLIILDGYGEAIYVESIPATGFFRAAMCLPAERTRWK